MDPGLAREGGTWKPPRTSTYEDGSPWRWATGLNPTPTPPTPTPQTLEPSLSWAPLLIDLRVGVSHGPQEGGPVSWSSAFVRLGHACTVSWFKHTHTHTVLITHVHIRTHTHTHCPHGAHTHTHTSLHYFLVQTHAPTHTHIHCPHRMCTHTHTHTRTHCPHRPEPLPEKAGVGLEGGNPCLQVSKQTSTTCHLTSPQYATPSWWGSKRELQMLISRPLKQKHLFEFPPLII